MRLGPPCRGPPLGSELWHWEPPVDPAAVSCPSTSECTSEVRLVLAAAWQEGVPSRHHRNPCHFGFLHSGWHKIDERGEVRAIRPGYCCYLACCVAWSSSSWKTKHYCFRYCRCCWKRTPFSSWRMTTRTRSCSCSCCCWPKEE